MLSNVCIYSSTLFFSREEVVSQVPFLRYGDIVFHELGPMRAVSVSGLDTLVDMFGMEVFSGRGSVLEMFGGENFNAEIRGGHGMHGLIASEGKLFG